jgi:putative tricarboxylic transport membrane protein
VLQAIKSKSWAEALAKNGWTPALLSGPEFDAFVDREFATLRAIMVKSGMV